MEKYGFIYIWYDRKHRRWYLGCHWGTVDDGYICSSRWMRNAHRRRPGDFRRRILRKDNMNRAELLVEEFRWLSMIKKEELGKRYYNVTKQRFGHWSTDEDKRQTIDNKASRPEVRAKLSKSMLEWHATHRDGQERRNQTVADALSREWIVIHPDGKKETVVNLKKFAREHSLCDRQLAQVADGEAKHHKGFGCVRGSFNVKRSLPKRLKGI
jgi:hypothetical protein